MKNTASSDFCSAAGGLFLAAPGAEGLIFFNCGENGSGLTAAGETGGHLIRNREHEMWFG